MVVSLFAYLNFPYAKHPKSSIRYDLKILIL